VSEPESIEADTASPVAPDPRVQQQANARREDARDNAASAALPRTDDAGEVVLAYCACVRGILNDAQGGPLHPPGLRMAEALGEVRESQRAKPGREKRGRAEEQLRRLAGCIDRGLAAVAEDQEVIRGHVEEVAKIAATLDPKQGNRATRRKRFKRLEKRLESSGDPVRVQMAVVMAAFVVGLFAGGDLEGLPADNLDLERWFRLPKGHERRISGRRHAGVRLVQEGATLMPVLDAHRDGGTFTAEELLLYRDAKPPTDEQEAIKRRKIMRKARSKKKRPVLLATLEQRYLNRS